MGALGDSRLLIKAARGDREAIATVIRQSLPKVRSKVEEAHETVRYYEANEWDREARRREAMAGEVSPEAAANAFEELYGRVLGVTHLFPLVLIAQGEERSTYEEKLGDNLYNLLLVFHNPAVRYAIVGSFDEAVREDVDELLGAIGDELWGTLLATTSSGDLSKDDLPEGTRATIEQLNESLEDMEGAE